MREHQSSFFPLIPPALSLALAASAVGYATLTQLRLNDMRAEIAAVFRTGVDCGLELGRKGEGGAS